MGPEGEAHINQSYRMAPHRHNAQHTKPTRPDIPTARPTTNNARKSREQHIFRRGEHSCTGPRTYNVFLLHAFVYGRIIFGRRNSGYCQPGNQARHRGIPAREAIRIICLEGSRISGLREPGILAAFLGYLHRAWVKLEIPVWIRSFRLQKH